LILLLSAIELIEKKNIIMKSLIIDAAENKIFLTIINNKNIYTSTHENSKSNIEKLVIFINEFLKNNKISMDEIDKIYVNRGPGSFAGIRNSLSVAKGIYLAKNIDYFCFSFLDFNESNKIEYKDVPNLCDKIKIKKNLINPLYLS